MPRWKQRHRNVHVEKQRWNKKPTVRPARFALIEGETGPDEHNANVQQSVRIRDISDEDPW